MILCDLNDIKMRVERQYENCHGYSGNKKTIYREAILAVKSILHSAKPIDAVPVVRCRECKHLGFCGDATNLEVMGFYGYCSRGERKEGAD